jgi:prefoldin subunit 5
MVGSLSPWVKFGLPAVAVIAGIGGYAVHEHADAKNLAAQNTQISAQLGATNSQIQALSAQVSALNASNQARTAVATAPSGGSARPAAGRPRAGSRAYDPRYRKLQSQLDAQGKAIDQTRADIASAQSDLSSTRTELSGSIARTHDDLVALQKRGERNYYEFDLDKSKDFKREGPIGIALRKANTRNQYADLQLMVEDSKLTQKHVNLYQPAMFYQPDSPQPIEIVINSISKNHVHGYISAPKYRQSELAAMSTPASNASQQADANPVGATQQANAAPQPSTRKKLTISSSDEVQ